MRRRRRTQGPDGRLRFLSPEQYRDAFGRDPVPPDVDTHPWPDAGGWQGWAVPWPPPTAIAVMAGPTEAVLWNRSPNSDGIDQGWLLDPEVLGLTAGLVGRLTAWNDRFGSQGAAWWEEGRSLARELHREFERRGLDVAVLFHDVDGLERAVR